uniref:SCP domain-containing protein n=1 Tax=Parastrongyloides trichosuri TaxID=131310 RepID=A0A0N4ZTB8_PARTI
MFFCCSFSDTKLSDGQSIERLKKHYLDETNKYRKLHHAENIKFCSKIEKEAQKYAIYLSKIKALKHSKTNLGENLALISVSKAKNAISLWYDEIKEYNFKNPGFNSSTGHFTQLVWKNTKKAGFGIAENDGIIYIVCQYDPPGNILDQYKENVLDK